MVVIGQTAVGNNQKRDTAINNQTGIKYVRFYIEILAKK